MSTRFPILRPALVAAGAVLALAGCSGGDQMGNSRGAYLGGLSKQVAKDITSIGKAKPAPAKPDPEAESRSALGLNKGPLVYISMEGNGYASVIGMAGENGAMRTYYTPYKQSIVLRNGLVAATRGFGFDMESADTASVESLIRSRRSGTAPKVIRYLDGLSLERPIPLSCQVSNTGKTVSYPFAGTTWSGIQMVEHCTGIAGLKLDNSYVVSAAGAIVSSRQWVTPQLGYMTIQTVRP
ncbi:YjbF family lipoprotein [Paenirhodobacter enshiensis]|uniref:YjbF family lipoprotein n=1 Tax=Paenirhodobacter enshiensis TaxID=1105367 RepID=UPI00068CC2E6|nr:YjbF family lipoprotein [Paenirhodobacter enshiensis]